MRKIHLRNIIQNFGCHILGYLFVAFFLDCWGRRPILVILQVKKNEQKINRKNTNGKIQIMSGLGCIAAGLLHGIQHLAALQLCLSLAR